MKTCFICKKKIRTTSFAESISQPIEEDFEECHLSCSTKPEQIKKYREYLEQIKIEEL